MILMKTQMHLWQIPIYSCVCLWFHVKQLLEKQTTTNQTRCHVTELPINPFSSWFGSKLYPLTWNPVFMSFWLGCKDTPCTAKCKEKSPFKDTVWIFVFFVHWHPSVERTELERVQWSTASFWPNHHVDSLITMLLKWHLISCKETLPLLSYFYTVLSFI